MVLEAFTLLTSSETLTKSLVQAYHNVVYASRDIMRNWMLNNKGDIIFKQP